MWATSNSSTGPSFTETSPDGYSGVRTRTELWVDDIGFVTSGGVASPCYGSGTDVSESNLACPTGEIVCIHWMQQQFAQAEAVVAYHAPAMNKQ